MLVLPCIVFFRKESCTPECLWAERKDFVFLTVQVTSPENLKVDLEEQSLDFYCTKGEKAYSCHLDFPESINVEESKYSTQRNVQFKLVKKEARRWHRVSTADKKKLHWLNSLGGAGGFGDMGDMGDSDDEDDLKDLDAPMGEDDEAEGAGDKKAEEEAKPPATAES
ncbi:p23 family protein [Cyclospora cayetanensis]|uniref:P23 family protein n=1 Tax=Cyclospora cayetanensis TaxID=88456 RepID=A0A1D3CVI5_9EIME|nr:p23 family protein [Cyclospora cayetanensis]